MPEESSWLSKVKQLLSKTLLVVGRVMVVLVVLAIIFQIIWLVPVFYNHYVHGQEWPTWTGFSNYISDPLETDKIFYRGKTLWDWLELLIVPIALAGLAAWFSWYQQKLSMKTEERRFQYDKMIALDNLRETALQNYLDKITELLLDKNLRIKHGMFTDSFKAVASARTVTVLKTLDKERKGAVVRFLYESDLIVGDTPVLYLSGADLSESNLSEANLNGANLRNVNLSKADMRGAYMANIDLQEANLTESTLDYAHLVGAYLSKCDLTNASLLNVDLRKADMWGANLTNANFTNADISEADLTNVEMKSSIISKEQLDTAKLTEKDF